MAGGEMHRDGATQGAAGDRNGGYDVQGVQQSGDLVRHRGDAGNMAGLLGKAGLAGVVSQYAPALDQRRKHVVPGLERAAHFVHQHDGVRTGAGEFVTQADAVDLDPVHWTRSLFNRRRRADGRAQACLRKTKVFTEHNCNRQSRIAEALPSEDSLIDERQPTPLAC
jgi:hypothetical protein